MSLASTNNSSRARSVSLPTLIYNILAVLFIVVAALAGSVKSCSSYKASSKIQLEKNGYKNILIAIGEDVAENYELIERIKTTYTEASSLLFNVTKKRAYFKEIIILLPNTWNLETYESDFSDSEFNYPLIHNATWETYDRADICIETRSPHIIDTPYVVNYATGCGEPSMHLHFTPEYFLNSNRALYTFGPYDSVLVHEWAHFRYGIFDEHPHKTPNNSHEFYINQHGEVEATRCSSSLKGHIQSSSDPSKKCNTFLANGLPSSDCSFVDEVVDRDPEVKIGSLMYKPFLKQLNAFCDNDPGDLNTFHNKFAPTLQNKECDGRSVWEVLRSHEDFRDFESMPNDLVTDTTPKFKVLKRRFNKIVVIIDKSLLFRLPRELAKIKAAINDYVKQLIGEKDLVGIVHFENNAEIVLPMTQIMDTQIRQKVYELSIPKSCVGVKNSNIFNALSLATKLLKSTVYDKSATHQTGGRIVLITNSKSDLNYPNREMIVNNVLKNQITVDVMEISDQKDNPLESLSAKTNGFYFLINKKNELLDITDSLIELANRELKPIDQVVELSDTFFLQSKQTVNTQFIFVDETIALRQDAVLVFKFCFEKLKEHVDVVVVEPRGKKHMLKTMDKCRDTSLFETTRNIDKTKQDVVCKFEIPSKGKWKFSIINSVSDQEFYVKLKVFVYFSKVREMNSYYPNYYSNRLASHAQKRDTNFKRSKRSTKIIDVIKLDAKWALSTVEYPKDTQIIYASVSKNLQPILNASVRAIIYRPKGDYISLELFDNGLNADRYADDGVYTRYFSNYNVDGIYFARIELKTDEFSKVNTQKIVGINSFDHFPTLGLVNQPNSSVFHPIDEIQRTNFIGSFNLEKFNISKDSIKPSMIKDIYVSELDEINGLATLRFTAPGDNANIGTAFRYDIKACYDPKILLDYDFYETDPESGQKTELINNNLVQLQIVNSSFSNNAPNQGGYEEYLTFSTKNLNRETVSIKIRAVDEHKNWARWSPIVTVKLSKQVKLAPNLRHYDPDRMSQQHLTDNKPDQAATGDSIYWEFFIFLIVMFCTIGLTQVTFLIVLTVIEVIDRRRNQIKPKITGKNHANLDSDSSMERYQNKRQLLGSETSTSFAEEISV